MSKRRRLTILALLATVGLGSAAQARAQNITIRTVPIPSGEQFLLFPSRALGMGSVGIAYEDREGHAFANPALRGESGVRFYVEPTIYGEANQWVGGRTLPVAVLFAGERIHGGAAIAMQQVRDRRPWGGWGWFPEDRNVVDDPSNRYLFGTVGARLGGGISVGVSAFRASLDAVDGVNMLYGNAARIDQGGTVTEYRLGLAAGLGEGRLDGTVTATETDMVHEVDYVEWVWSGEPEDPGELVQWTERNEDHTTTWGTRLRYTRPVGPLARVGFVLAGSVKDHPKIPNYNIVNIPRDPGHSAMFNIGLGAVRSEDGATFSVEAIIEPGRSHTWAFADSVTALPSGAQLEPGDKTVDNRFRFLNWVVGMGFAREHRRFDWQLGLRVRQVDYHLDQHNFLAEQRRETRDAWMEWAPSWGAGTRFGDMEIRYAGRFTARGWPAVNWWLFPTTDVAAGSGPEVDFVVGPTGEVNLPAYRVTTHRLTVSVPLFDL